MFPNRISQIEESVLCFLLYFCQNLLKALKFISKYTSEVSKSEKAFRYDRSIVLNGIGKVVSAVSSTGYIKIEVVRGPCTQTVFGLDRSVPNKVNLAERYPVGTLVS